jgi:O-ureido-D-serine cyclo-ligase
VPVVPTRFVAPGTDAAAELERFLAGGIGALSVGHAERFADFVVKPSVGAGSRDAARYRRADRSQAHAHLARLTGVGRHAMLQPYLERVDQSGETALMYFDGGFSHSVRKGPILRVGAGFVAGLFASEATTARPAEEDERRVADAACRAIPGGAPLYARVDLVRGDDGLPVLLELELTEPSLYLQHATGSAQRLAQAVLARCNSTD